MRTPLLSLAVIAAAGLPLILAPARAAGEAVSLETLLEEMTDREQLARFPSPSYTCRQFSSYDRDTTGRGEPGWYANWDRSQFVRTEENQGRTEQVLLDAKGPGAIVRFWATWHGPGGGPFSNGTLRFYIDEAKTPAIEGPAADIISGGRLVGPPLSASVSPTTNYAQRGHNLYLPIPYAKRCKITYETDVLIDRGGKKGEALYYQINYRTYAEGTGVRSFSLQELEKLESKIARAQSRLMESGLAGKEAPKAVNFDGEIAAGKSRTVEIEGPRAIRELELNLDAADREQALRSTVLEIEFDGRRCVWCPVGDFFGVGYRPKPYQTWYTRATLDGSLDCFWVMPFAKSCRLTLRNLGDQEVDITLGRARIGDWRWDDRSLHFHSTWRQYTRIDTGPNKDMTGKGAFDVNFVEVDGQGVYVGDTLAIFNGTDAWWGEGDEKIFVDGEAFPSHVGTGTEDYYGYAWCKPNYFCMPFHAQPDGSGNFHVGFSVNSRYRALDAIPFKRSIRMDMEMWHWRSTRINYAPSTFWYARPGASSNVKPDPKTAAMAVARAEDDVIEVFRVKGTIEAESLKIVETTGGKVEVQKAPEHGWSGNRQVWWMEGKVGDRLALELPVKKAGRYRVKANLTKAVDYGIVSIEINGVGTEKKLDRYHQGVETDVVELGVFELRKGENRVEVKIEGSNPAAVKKHMFGLDYLLLERQ